VSCSQIFAIYVGLVAPSGECLCGKDAGLAEINDSLPPVDDFKSHPWADCMYTGISTRLSAQ